MPNDNITDLTARLDASPDFPGAADAAPGPVGGAKADTDALANEFLAEFGGAEEAETPEFLIPLRRVPADDMPLTIGGLTDPETGEEVGEATYYLQKGRSVWFLPITSFATMFSTAGLLMSSKRENAAAMVKSMGDLCARLSEVVARWDLVGPDGTPLPQPYKRPEVIMGLTEDQLGWVIEHATARESKEKRGNG